MRKLSKRNWPYSISIGHRGGEIESAEDWCKLNLGNRCATWTCFYESDRVVFGFTEEASMLVFMISFGINK